MTDASDTGALGRRIFDIVVASSVLVLASPLFLLIMLAILIESGRPVFFSQTRIGWKGEPFQILKFRKFGKDVPAGGSLLTVRNDPRMTPLGRLLERSKLDELPQFFNVLRGDMAIIGPRPDTEVAIRQLKSRYRALLDYKPGIFGPAQVAFRSAGKLYPVDVHPHTFYRERILPVKARLDLEYYPNRTLWRDFEWLLRGGLAVLGLHPVLRSLPALAARTRDAAEVARDLSSSPGGALDMNV